MNNSFNIVRLSPSQKAQIARKCKNRLDWTDSGHWIGNGKQPNCFHNLYRSNTLSQVVHFLSDEAASQWNADCEKAIRYGGHFATAAITIATALTTKGALSSTITGVIAAVAKDEAQATINYPRVAKDWQYQITLTNSLHWSAHPWGRKQFTQKITSITKNEQEKEEHRSSSSYRYQVKDITLELALRIVESPSRVREFKHA